MKKRAKKRRIDTTHPLGPPIRNSQAIWLEGPVPRGFWNTQSNRSLYLRWLGQQLGFRKLEDWHKITTNDLKQNRGGGVLLNYWNSSAIAAVKECYPDRQWNEWQFRSCPRAFWADPKNHRRYMQWLGERRGVKRPQDWYKVTNRHFATNKGGAFLLHYNSTVSAAIMKHLSDYDWKEWMFSKTPKGFWDKKKNRKRYLDWLGKKLGIKKPEDWYKIKRKKYEANYGNNFLKLYDGSPCSALKDVYPRVAWKEWMFARAPLGFWKDRENRRRYIRWLARELGIRSEKNWSKIRRVDVRNNHGRGFLAAYSSFASLMQDCR